MEDATTGTRSILRVHRQNYHLPHQIESELDWLDALRARQRHHRAYGAAALRTVVAW